MKIVADAHIPFVKEYFNSYGELILTTGRTLTAHHVKDADILLIRSVTHVDENLLRDSKVKFVGSVTAGKDHLDTKWLDEAGISWSIAAGFNAPPVADYVLSVIAALQQKRLMPTKHVKVAVVGVGNVGRLVVDRLKLLDFDITLTDPVRAQHEKDFLSVPIETLSDVDFISLHVPLTRSGDYPTYHFINKAFLQRQKPGCVLLNASRGAVMNSQELIMHGNHLNWCLDVWENEPHIDKHILEKAQIATPHIAGYSLQSKMRGIDMIYRIACEKNIIKPQAFPPLQMPTQQLAFAGTNHRWQDVVMGVFNPLVVTAMMRTMLLPAKDCGPLFDEMRNQFNYRHEFAFTKLVEIDTQDIALLAKFGFAIF